MKELEGQVSHQFSPKGAAVQLNPEGVGHNDTQGVVGVLANGHEGGGGQVGVSVLQERGKGLHRREARVGEHDSPA